MHEKSCVILTQLSGSVISYSLDGIFDESFIFSLSYCSLWACIFSFVCVICGRLVFFIMWCTLCFMSKCSGSIPCVPLNSFNETC